MNKQFPIVASIIALVAAVFFAGFLLGRNSVATNSYDTRISAVETPLVGHWRIASNVEPKVSAIEFRPNRIAIKYKDDGEPGLSATWGRIGDELSIQNAHVQDEERFYVPPSLFKVLTIAENQIDLVTLDGSVKWKLTRL